MTAHGTGPWSHAMLRAVLVVLATLGGAGCGGAADQESGPPPSVPAELAPPTALGGQLSVVENTDDSTRRVLTKQVESSLVAETRVWELRRADRLVATLQISTVLPKVDFDDQDIRERFAAQVILGQRSRLRVGDVEVFTATANDKTVYLWFGARLYQVLQTKDRELEPETLLADLIQFQRDKPGWVPVAELVED